MKAILGTMSFFLLSFGNSIGQEQLSLSEFQVLCDSTGFVFEMPEGYSIIEVKENRDLYYNFAVINVDSSMEIRYTLWPLQSLMKEYVKSLTDSNSVMVHPDKIYPARVQANVLNMTGGQMYDIGPFPPRAVKTEFGADDGGSCFLEFNSQFGEGYKFGQFIYLHKNGVADAIVTFLSNDRGTHSDLMMAGFHSLKYK